MYTNMKLSASYTVYVQIGQFNIYHEKLFNYSLKVET